VVLVESLRPGVVYVSSRPGAPTCVENTGVVICALGRIPGGSGTSVDVRVGTDGTDPSSGRTEVTVNGQTVGVIDEPYILKIGQPPVAAPGAPVTYTIRIINPTTQTASNVRVVDMMPDAILIESAASTSGNVTVDGQNITFTQAQLAPGARVTITLTTRVSSVGDFNEITNRACLTSSLNRRASCAEMTFLRAGSIPGTGETPIYRRMLVPIVIGAVLVGLVWLIRRRL
jgi:uncharacterized repeat protein (TIGR01451 family)